MLGPKIDARLNALERKLTDLTHRLERLEKPIASDEAVMALAKAAQQDATFTTAEAPKRRGRPPKAKNG